MGPSDQLLGELLPRPIHLHHAHADDRRYLPTSRAEGEEGVGNFEENVKNSSQIHHGGRAAAGRTAQRLQFGVFGRDAGRLRALAGVCDETMK